MATTTMLDNISTAIEQVVKTLHGSVAPTKKRMPLGAFVTFALTEIEKAAKDEPPVAQRRLTALKRNVDDVITAIAKLSVEDTESEDIDVEVTTAFVPTKADGDTPADDLTTGSDQSSTEVSLTGVSSASGDSAFAENLGQVAKALQKLKDELGAASDESRGRVPRRRMPTARANAATVIATPMAGRWTWPPTPSSRATRPPRPTRSGATTLTAWHRRRPGELPRGYRNVEFARGRRAPPRRSIPARRARGLGCGGRAALIGRGRASR